MRNQPRAQTETPERTALKHLYSTWAHLLYRVQGGPKYELWRPRPGRRSRINREFAVTGDTTRLRRRLLLFGFARAQQKAGETRTG